MSHALDERYLTWLYRQVCSVRAKNPARTYWSLFRQLYTTEFVWFVPNDDNRAMDGKALRDEFVEDERLDDVDHDWMELECSMLEMLIALARRLEFEDGCTAKDWFWQLLTNLELDSYNDRSRYSHEDVAAKLDMVNRRTYTWDGRGGLFPLRNPHYDQRKIEIWYQACAYLLQGD